MDMKIEDILNYQLGKEHPLKRNSSGLKAFARLGWRFEKCPDQEARRHIEMIEKHLKKLEGCNCYIKMHLFLSIFCAGRMGMSAKAQHYFNLAKEMQQAFTNRGSEQNYFSEVYEAVAHEADDEHESILEKWPLCEMGAMRFAPIKKSAAIKYSTLMTMLKGVMNDDTVNSMLNNGKVDIIDDDSGDKIGKISFNSAKEK